MATSLPYFCSLTTPSYKPKVLLKHPQVIRSQSFYDEGKSRNLVDENMRILRERIRGVRKKERNEMCCKLDNGWNYKAHRCDNKHKSRNILSELIALVVLVSSSLGLVFLSGSFCIFLVSFAVKHLYP